MLNLGLFIDTFINTFRHQASLNLIMKPVGWFFKIILYILFFV